MGGEPRTEIAWPPRNHRGPQEGLPRTPELQTRVNEMFRESGLAGRLLSSLHATARTVTNWGNLTSNIEDCNFGVYRRPKANLRGSEPFDHNTIETYAVIEFPNAETRDRSVRWSEHFQVEPGRGFGLEPEDAWRERRDGHAGRKTGRPLNDRQLQVVEEVVKLQEAETASQEPK